MKAWLPVGAVLAALALAGCETMQNLNVGGLTGGKLNFGSGGSNSGGIDIMKASNAVKKLRSGFSDISESEEYYIGRAVAAQIMGRYRPLEDDALNRYAQTVAEAVAAASDRPATYKGYHVQVLDSDEVNAFAAPGGFLFVTKGLLRLVKSEDELACVLAHEVAHVAKKHGLKTIQTARLTSAFAILGEEAAKRYSSEQVRKLTTAFEGSIDDIVNRLVVDGYSRDKEYEADKFAAVYAKNAGYDPDALESVLKRMESAEASGLGMFKTHPAPEKRLAQLRSLSAPDGWSRSDARDARFGKALAF